jgi:hypothetical protein
MPPVNMATYTYLSYRRSLCRRGRKRYELARPNSYFKPFCEKKRYNWFHASKMDGRTDGRTWGSLDFEEVEECSLWGQRLWFWHNLINKCRHIDWSQYCTIITEIIKQTYTDTHEIFYSGLPICAYYLVTSLERFIRFILVIICY